MFNIIYYQQKIDDNTMPSLKLYNELLNNNLVNMPAIFADQCISGINKNIPIFNSYYLRHHFHKNYILCDIQDYDILKSYLIRSPHESIVIYNALFHDPATIDSKLRLSSETNILSYVKEHCHESV